MERRREGEGIGSEDGTEGERGEGKEGRREENGREKTLWIFPRKNFLATPLLLLLLLLLREH